MNIFRRHPPKLGSKIHKMSSKPAQSEIWTMLCQELKIWGRTGSTLAKVRFYEKLPFPLESYELYLQRTLTGECYGRPEKKTIQSHFMNISEMTQISSSNYIERRVGALSMEDLVPTHLLLLLNLNMTPTIFAPKSPHASSINQLIMQWVFNLKPLANMSSSTEGSPWNVKLMLMAYIKQDTDDDDWAPENWHMMYPVVIQ